MTDWSHLRIENPAVARAYWEEIAAEASDMLERARKGYPFMIKRGEMTQEDAAADLYGRRATESDWHWIAFGEGKPASAASLDARIAALDQSLVRWFKRVDKHGGVPTAKQAVQGALIAAMRWWAERERTGVEPHVRDLAAFGHNWRKENGHPSLGESQAARTSNETHKFNTEERKAA